MRNLLLLISACLLSGCFGLTDEAAVPRDIPPSLLVPPQGVTDLPARPLGDQEAEILWGRDRDRLGMCVSQTGGLIAAVTQE